MSLQQDNNTHRDTLSVLMLSPHPNVPGGVSNYAEMLKAHLKSTRVVPFWVGRPANESEGALTKTLRLLIGPFRVARRIQAESIDVVHINPSLDAKSLIRDGLILAALRFIKFSKTLVTIHGWSTKTAQFLDQSKLLGAVTAKLLNGCARILVLAPEFKKQLIAIGVDAEKIIVTSTMFDAKRIALPAEHRVMPKTNILFMSRFHSPKGMDMLLDAYIRLLKDYPELDLILAGDGKERLRLTNKVVFNKLSSRVTFTGYVSGLQKARLLNDCSIFALPTRDDEGMPIVLLEAMAVGKPILTTKVGGLASIVKDGDNGVVLDVATVDTVEKGLRDLLNDPEACRRMGAYNAVYVAERFSAPVVSQEIESLYRACVR